MKQRNRGQSTAEYAVLIAVVVGAVIAMQLYLKRGIQGKLKGGMDQVAIPGTNAPAQYEPYYAESNMHTTQHQNMKEDYIQGAVTRQGGSGVDRQGTEQEHGAEALGSDAGWK